MSDDVHGVIGGIGNWITRRVFYGRDQVAIVDGDRRMSYADFDRRTDQLASALCDRGVRRGERVACLEYNGAPFLELLFATAKLGAIFVPINFRLATPEVAYILSDSGAGVFAWSGPLSQLARDALACDGVRVGLCVTVEGEPDDHEMDYETLLNSGRPQAPAVPVPDGDVAMLMYTSGTTGRPKGVMLTHGNLLWNAINVLSSDLAVRSSDRTVTVAPMFHIGALGLYTLPLLYVGGTVAILPSFDPAETLAAMARERATVQFLVPSMWSALMGVADFENYDLSALEVAITGGAPCPLPVLEYFRSRGVPFQEGFGMTETSPGATVREKAGSIGRPLYYMQTRIVDENDREVATGEVGELVLRGPNVFVGYWGLPEATAEAFRGGWFHTGDLGRVDGEGFITLVDRKKDMIITGGENVYPIEVEQVLWRHQAIREVAVVGVPDPRWGETPIAVVALEDGAELAGADLIAFARERLAHFKCPTRVEYVAELPRNATGKVLKRHLREQFGADRSGPT